MTETGRQKYLLTIEIENYLLSLLASSETVNLTKADLCGIAPVLGQMVCIHVITTHLMCSCLLPHT